MARRFRESAPGEPRRRAALARLARYGATSVVAFGVSEITLLALYGWKVTGVTTAAVVGNVAGTIPSYLMSRYWIWSEAPRARVGRQVAMYWTTSIICIAGTSLATGAVTKLAPPGHHFHLAVAGVAFFLVNVVFWFGKFEVYQRIIFPIGQRRTLTRDGSSAHESDGLVGVEPNP